MRMMGAPSLLPGDDVRVRRARARLRSCHARGMSFHHLSRQTGLSYRTLSHTYYRNGGMWRSTLLALTKMQFEEPDPTAIVSAVGTQRRLMALWADGFPTPWVADRMDVGPRQYVRRLAIGVKGASGVTYATHRKVAELYEKLVGVNPEDEPDITKVGRAKARNAARRQGIPGRACWDPDTIDDPDAHPEWTGACGTAEGVRIHRREGIPVCAFCRTACATAWVDDFDPAKMRELRTAHGWSLRALAAELGFAYRTVLEWESGKRTPTWGKIQPVLSLLDATITDVQTRKESG